MAASMSRQLAQWVAGLRYEDLPPAVVDRAKGVAPGIPIPAAQFDEVISACGRLEDLISADRLIELTLAPSG